MNKLVDSESLGKFKEIIDKKLKNKVSKKKKSQVIIGRAIKPKSCEIGGMENWYAFAGEPAIYLSVDYNLKDVYIKPLLGIEYVSNSNSHSTYPCYQINGAPKNSMWRVDRYEIDENNNLSIWLSYKKNSNVQKGTSTRFEINNGRKYDTRKILPQDISNFLEFIHDNTEYAEGELRVKSENVILKRLGQCYKNRRIRELFDNEREKKKKLKWTNLHFPFFKNAPIPLRLKNIGGKYKIRFMNKRNAYSPPVTFYVKRNLAQEDFKIQQITIE